jgi:hypothetical protein
MHSGAGENMNGCTHTDTHTLAAAPGLPWKVTASPPHPPATLAAWAPPWWTALQPEGDFSRPGTTRVIHLTSQEWPQRLRLTSCLQGAQNPGGAGPRGPVGGAGMGGACEKAGAVAG